MTLLAQGTATAVLDLAKTVVPALVALLGVWVGSGLTRGRERRAWLRDRLVGVCSSLVDATAAVEQWAASAQFAGRLAAGQYPTEYKDDLARLGAAVASVSISASPALRASAADAEKAVRDYVTASAEQQAARAASSPGGGPDVVDAARTRWTAARTHFLSASRTELDAVK